MFQPLCLKLFYLIRCMPVRGQGQWILPIRGQGHVLVADTLNHRILRFRAGRADGELVAGGRAGHGLGELGGPLEVGGRSGSYNK